MKHYVVKIYKSVGKINSNSLKKLEIGGKIGFLKQVILSSSRFLKEDNKNWHLKFFCQSSYEQYIVVKIIDIPESTPNEKLKDIVDSERLDYREYDELSTLSCILQDCEMNSNIAERLSLSVRGSKSIKCNDFTQRPSHYNHIDGRGLSFFSRITNQEDNFKRQIILVSLAYAYLGAIEYIGNQLAEAVNDTYDDIKKLRELYINTAKFNSTFFFHQPVLIKNPSLTEIWKKIDKTLDVNASSGELLEQLANVHYILNLDNERNAKVLQDRWNKWFSILGIFISILGLFELFK
ncbi:hypothetical protein [Rodentibacter caecimuris]|uniref:hypothetical protein n=1 Tax=Rodentibacter caecimuris TaxID=1796644 RepID=UPI00211A5486|nr:hypothetical protein [Rodentibacter heylii]MCQ9123866.1 hypothetical protein [Rodentibacter heylii]